MATPNAHLVQAVLDQVVMHPESHYQGYWIAGEVDGGYTCDTTACVAGWAVLLNEEGYVYSEDLGMVLTPDGLRLSFRTAGMRLLGLTPEQAAVIFYASEADAIEGLKDALNEAVPNGA